MSKIEEQTPAQIDTQIAEIQQRAARPKQRLSSALRYLEENSHDSYMRARYEKEQIEAEEQIEALRQEAAPFEAEYVRRGGWTRFFHVTNTNGHVHNSMHCSSCFFDTQYAWRTDLSGLTEEEVVEREAYQACSVCMPIAPAVQKAAFKAHQAEKREAKAAEKAQKAAEKEARKLKREESLAHKVNAAIDKYETGEQRKQAWWDGKITDSVYDVLYDMGYGEATKY